MSRVSVPANDIRRGVLAMLIAVTLFAVMTVLVKLLTARYPVAEVVFARNLFALAPVWLIVRLSGGRAILRTRRLGGHLWRATIGMASMGLLFWAYRLLPMADVVAISFTSPLFMTALSQPLLGEKVGPWRWGAVIFGFCGVLLMARPSGAALDGWGGFLALGSAFCYALAMLTIRSLSRSESSASIILYFTLFSTALSALPLPLVWVTPDALAAAEMVALGVVGGTAQYFLTRAYSHAPAAVVGPLNYTSYLWAALSGYWIWGEQPSATVFQGAAIVIAGSLFVLYRETRR